MTISMELECDNKLGFPYEDLIRSVVIGALDSEDFPFEAEVNILLTDNEAIHEINRDNRGIDAPTDVLSFPMADYPAPGDFSELEEDDSLFNPDSGELLLGDMVISLDRVLSQAAEYGHSPRRELAFLVAHSMFHLMGYDHMTEDERAVMEEKQEALLQELGLTRDMAE